MTFIWLKYVINIIEQKGKETFIMSSPISEKIEHFTTLSPDISSNKCWLLS